MSNSAIQIAIATASPAQIASFYVSSFHSIIICFFNGQLRLFSFYLFAFSIRFFAFLCNFSHPTVKKKCNLDCGLDCNRKLWNYTKKKRRIIGLAKSFFLRLCFQLDYVKWDYTHIVSEYDWTEAYSVFLVLQFFQVCI